MTNDILRVYHPHNTVQCVLLRMKRVLQRFGMIPTYTETALFLTSIAVVVLLVVSEDMRHALVRFLVTGKSLNHIFVVGMVAVGLVLAICHASITRNKTSTEKFFLLIFALAIDVLAGWNAGLYTLTHSAPGFLMLFPIWNILHAAALVFLFRVGIINTKAISNTHASFPALLIGTLVLGVVMYVTHVQYGLYWALTLSVAVGAATSMSNILERAVGTLQRIRVER